MIWRALSWPFVTMLAAFHAKEIENEVEALSTDALKRRSRVWVRNTTK